jgi:hypothetical protein
MRTSYSRRELYALGEPLGDSATYCKADGGFILGDGGGSSQSAAPSNTTSTSTQTTELPEWARGYAKDALAKGQALTDVNQNPYQTYSNPRIAGFSPMQQQSFEGAANMQVAPQIGQGTAAATMAGLGGLGVAGQANVAGFQNQVGGYMNPYMNQILAPQLAEANRNYDIGATKQQSAATQAGAFGGSREAIMAAENERNRNTGLNQIYGQGLNTAYTNAQNQYNQNLQNQLAGYGMANQAAGQLGQLGQNQYQQSMGINTLQNQYGGQQQALQQQGLSQAYQDFQNQQNYPYKQLGFMSDLIRGLPLGQQSTKSLYEPPPSTAQSIGQLGLGAYGIGQMFKAEGGTVKSMAGGGLGGEVPGGSVMSREFKEEAVGNIPTDRGLQAAAMGAQARGDLETQLAAQNEMSEDAAIRRGVSGQVPPQFADNMVRAANGGIVAFALGGDTSYQGLLKQVSGFDVKDAPTPEQTIEGISKFQKGLETAYGPSQLDPYVEQVKADRAANKERSGSDTNARMAFAAAEALGSGPTLRHVLGKTIGAAGREGTAAMKEFKEADRLDRQAEIALVGANQARKDGMTGKAAELNTANNMLSQKAQEIKLGALEKSLTASAGVEHANISAAASKYATDVGAASKEKEINKPGERERQLAEIDKIKSGATTYMGLKGEEGVAAYLENEAKLGAAKFGVKYSGTDPAWAHQNMIATALAKRGDYDDANSAIVRLEKKEKLNAGEQAMLDKLYGTKRRIEAEVRAQYPKAPSTAGAANTGAANTGGAGAPTLAEFMAAARAAPQNRGISDEQLAAHYHRTYGAQ